MYLIIIYQKKLKNLNYILITQIKNEIYTQIKLQ
jgi:hypothetical protein